FGERMRIIRPCNCTKLCSGSVLEAQSRRGTGSAPLPDQAPSGRGLVTLSSSASGRSSALISIRPDIRLLDDGSEALRRLFHAGIQLRRARWEGIPAAAGEALLDVGHAENLHDFAVELVDHRLGSALRGEQRGPIGGIDLADA